MSGCVFVEQCCLAILKYYHQQPCLNALNLPGQQTYVPNTKPICSSSYTHRVGFAFPGRQWSALPAPRTWKPIGACRFEGEGDVTGSLLRDFDWSLARFLCPAVAPGTEHRWPVKRNSRKEIRAAKLNIKRQSNSKPERNGWR